MYGRARLRAAGLPFAVFSEIILMFSGYFPENSEHILKVLSSDFPSTTI
jgi:hypothetical protein